MAVSLSPFAGAGWQFFDNNGVILSGGKLYVYAAGTTSSATTYTSSTGSTANTNPIILNSSGRLANEIWLTTGLNYKFILKTSADVLIGTWDNIPAGTTDVADLQAALASSTGAGMIGYTQGNANAVATTVQTKLRETVSVKDFGAVGDGVADDTAAIQAALSSGAGMIFVSAGTYKLTASLQMANNQTIFGVGVASVLSFVSNSAADNLRLKCANNTRVDNLRVTETSVTGRTGVYGLVFGEGKTNIAVTRVVADNSSSTGMFFIDCHDVLVDNCFVSDTKADGIHSQRGSSNIIVRGCVITNPQDDGISFVSHGYTTYGNVNNCIAENNIIDGTMVTGSGIAAIGAMYVTIANNIIRDTQLVGIRVTGASFVSEGDTVGGHITINGNKISNTGLVGSGGELGGIYIDSNRYVLVKDNSIFNSPSYGISASTCWVDIDIHSNNITNVVDPAIYATATPQTGYYLQLWTNSYLTDGTSAATVCGQSITIKDNTIRSIGGTGIYITGNATESVNTVDIKNNSMYRLHTNSSITPAYAIRADYCSNVTETGNASINPVNALTVTFTSTGSTNLNGVSNTNLPLQNGLSVNASNIIGTNRQYSNGAAPTTGAYVLGDFVWNYNPASGVLGWICTASGSPGTWSTVNVN